MKTFALIWKIVIIILMANHTFGHPVPPHMPRTPGIHDQIIELENGKPLRFGLALPADYSAHRPMPLIMALHYGGPVTPHYGRDFLTILPEPALRGLGAIMAAPDCPGEGWTDPVSVSAVLTLLQFIRENYIIDQHKIMVTGFSLGAIGTWHLAAEYPDIFSAAIPISGMTDEKTLAKIRDIPIYVIHSRRDEIFPIHQVETLVDILKQRGVSIQFKTVEGISHYHTAGFSRALKGAVDWVERIWNR